MIGKRKLKRPDYNYIKTVHPEGHELYKEWINLLDEFQDIMATHQYDRRMLKIEPVRLGLKPEAFSTRIYTPQHNLSSSKIKAMEAITIEKEKNGFFIPGNGFHNIPYGMFIRRKGDGTPDRFKEFYDLRELNKYVDVKPAKIPTMPK